MEIKPSDYSFTGLLREVNPVGEKTILDQSLVYVVGIVSTPSHPITDPVVAKRTIQWLYEVEEQSINAEHFAFQQSHLKRYYSEGYQAKTPCMVRIKWSPILAMLEAGFQPVKLEREKKFRATASGVWKPLIGVPVTPIEKARTDDELFWGMVGKVSAQANEQGAYLSIIARIGYSYESAIHSLPAWPREEINKSGRILWKRTVLG